MSNFTNQLRKLRRAFHRTPELGFEEHRTKAAIVTHLQTLGIEYHEGVGVVGVLKKGTGQNVIALRADMDALPINEASSHDYVSTTTGVMHACGHDGHMTMLLGAAEILSKEIDFDGTVLFLFQPNEEHGLGARAMIDEGVLTRHNVQEIFAIHNLPAAPLGQVSSRAGQICASESLFEMTIIGQGGHASMPHVGVDAITVGAEIVTALQTIVARKLAPDAGAVVSVTEFITDGQRNVLPGRATLKGDVRCRLPEDRIAVEKFMRQIATGIALAHGHAFEVQIEFSFNTEFVEVINADAPTQAVYRAAQSAGLDLIKERPPMSFSEDFAHFSNEIPGCFLLMGNGTQGVNAQPLHNETYDFNDDLLPLGVEFWVALVRDRLPA